MIIVARFEKYLFEFFSTPFFKYVEWVDDHPRSINEFNKFVNGGHISAIRKKIQAKWHISNLSNKQVLKKIFLFFYIYKNK